MITKINATKLSKIQSVLQDFPKEFMENFNNKLYCSLCSCMVCYKKHLLTKSVKQHI